ncbi:MAG: hypothetical protein L0332_19515 [Chloroflexi bacterium]|nr:hypothetical protein [Chloroflexota bacterium]MCI0574701.1 hypothetical protein [Chloroflexota bacterium]MCI0647406.1 hypothetical protein [Chloroflexota bacterium]MCI0728885.1 hypothetical protein [Chloroflexota bacterium]
MALLQVYAFGKLRLQYGDELCDVFPTHHVAELLGYLLLNQARPHSRETLIEILWPENPPAAGRASLSTALWRLRRVFDGVGAPADAFLHATREWICFEPGRPMRFDLADFEGYLARAEETGDAAAREQLLQAAAGVYQGRLYEGLYADWCLLERERLERRYLRALGQLMAGAIQRQTYQEAAEMGQAILRRDPLREEVHRALMRCYWQMGNNTGAIRQFQACARLLQEELQILPMAETIALYQQITHDRLAQFQATPSHSPAHQRQIEAAYSHFLTAAEALNELLGR